MTHHPPPPPSKQPGGAGWSGPIIARLAAIMARLEHLEAKKAGLPPPLPPFIAGLALGVEGGKETSDNHEAEGWGGELCRAWLAGDGRFLAARAVSLEAYFPRELALGPRGVGLQGGEGLVPSAHDVQHNNGVAFHRLAAWLSKDPELLALSEKLLLTAIRAKLCVASSDLTVCSPGRRTPGKPVYAGDTALLRVCLGHDPKVKNLDSDQFYVSIRCLEYLRRAGDPLLKKTATMTLADMAPCVLKTPMDVYRGRGWYFAELPKPASGKPEKQVCNWVLAVDGREPQYGLNWQTAPAPMPGKPGRRIHFPGIGER